MVKLPEPTLCPILDRDCEQFKCMFWTQLLGTDPQTGKEVNEYDCAVKWLPLLLIEGAKEARQTAAAVESFRNEMVKANQIEVTHLSLAKPYS